MKTQRLQYYVNITSWKVNIEKLKFPVKPLKLTVKYIRPGPKKSKQNATKSISSPPIARKQLSLECNSKENKRRSVGPPDNQPPAKVMKPMPMPIKEEVEPSQATQILPANISLFSGTTLVYDPMLPAISKTDSQTLQESVDMSMNLSTVANQLSPLKPIEPEPLAFSQLLSTIDSESKSDDDLIKEFNLTELTIRVTRINDEKLKKIVGDRMPFQSVKTKSGRTMKPKSRLDPSPPKPKKHKLKGLKIKLTMKSNKQKKERKTLSPKPSKSVRPRGRPRKSESAVPTAKFLMIPHDLPNEFEEAYVAYGEFVNFNRLLEILIVIIIVEENATPVIDDDVIEIIETPPSQTIIEFLDPSHPCKGKVFFNDNLSNGHVHHKATMRLTC